MYKCYIRAFIVVSFIVLPGLIQETVYEAPLCHVPIDINCDLFDVKEGYNC